MLNRTKTTLLASALILAVSAPAFAGEGSADLNSAPYGSRGYDAPAAGWTWQEPSGVVVAPAEDDDMTGYAEPSSPDDDDDDMDQ